MDLYVLSHDAVQCKAYSSSAPQVVSHGMSVSCLCMINGEEGMVGLFPSQLLSPDSNFSIHNRNSSFHS